MGRVVERSEPVVSPSDSDVPLHRLPVGGRARVVAVRGEPEVRRRLLEMGLCRGVEVVCRRRAWWGDPIEFDVRGYRLALRAALAGEVTVCPMDAGV